MNQCDGCARGMPVDERGLHVGLHKWDVMFCSKHLYEDPKRDYNLISRYLKKRTRKNAIHAFCFHCVGGTKDDMPDEGYQVVIKTCMDKDCPLYRYRPYS